MAAKPKTKVVVRHLPPSLQEDSFRKLLGPLESAAEWLCFVPGRVAYVSSVAVSELEFHLFYSQKGIEPARAYLSFKSHADILSFAQQFDGRPFVDTSGKELRCLVEYAPYQKVPRRKPVRDAKAGTLEKDPEYTEFVESLRNPVVPAALKTEIGAHCFSLLHATSVVCFLT